MLVGLGILFRALAFWSLVAFNRDKRHLPTLAQLSLYWVVNPLDNLANARRERRHEERRAERIRRFSVQPHNQLPSLGVRVGNPFGGPVLERPPASRYSGYQPPPQQQEPQQPQQPRLSGRRQLHEGMAQRTMDAKATMTSTSTSTRRSPPTTFKLSSSRN